ncbi:MAG: class I SAM-dependent methyltransferase [Acidimicrobiales bacterium]|nr:class I SAM-dependent methyltransferase [Acidimicrobiales bacterium]
MLALVFQELRLFISTSTAVLDYAPNRQMQKLLKRRLAQGGGTYVGVDLMDDRFIDSTVDACHLPFPDSAFDLIVQFHVLEHIPDDGAAIREMARVLKPGGLCLVQVPCRRDRLTDEDPSAPEEERIVRFGQADHIRYYGSDFDDRLRANGLDTTFMTSNDLFSDERRSRFRLNENDPLWICRKAQAAK